MYWFIFRNLPDLSLLSQRLSVPSVRITDRDAQLLYEIIPQEGGRHTNVSFSSLPISIIQATIATEDHSFYQNPGVDLLGILRAFLINLRGGETIAGGSTITQQLVRNLLMDEERYQRTIRRKLRESYLAWQISQHFSKEDILNLYLNQTYYGGMAYGIEAAAQTYFGKSAEDLDLAESALLAGIPQAPAIYNPFTNPDKAKQRQMVVLGLMEAQGYISLQQRSLAEKETLNFTATPYPIKAPHFVMMVSNHIDQILADCGIKDLRNINGLTVKTTLNLGLQSQAENIIQNQLESLQNPIEKGWQDSLAHNVHNAALLALDPSNGEILTLVGNSDYFNTQYSGAINMVTAKRQPGSSLKPFVYAAAFDPSRNHNSGGTWTAATMILDVKTNFITHDDKPYTPSNYDGKEHGPVLAREALASSLNIPAVLTLKEVGITNLFSLLADFGITSFGNPNDYDLSLALGGGEVSLLDLSSAYGVFANGGYLVKPIDILEMRDGNGELIFSGKETKPAITLPRCGYGQTSEKKRVIDERIAWLISNILNDNDARSLGFGRNSALHLDRPAAVKTGTTSNFHDNWTVGYTPELVVGVWVGNANHEPMNDVSGLSGAGPIWHQFIRVALKETHESWYQRPAGLTQIDVCSLSGLLPTTECPYRKTEWFLEGTEPTQRDHYYKIVYLDRDTGEISNQNTLPESLISQVVLDLPVSARNWAHAQGLTLLSDLKDKYTIDSSKQTGKTSTNAIISLINPRQNAVFRFLPSAGGDQKLHFLASVDGTNQENQPVEISFWVDHSLIFQKTIPPYETWWKLKIGKHQAWVEMLNSDGKIISSETVEFEVIP